MVQRRTQVLDAAIDIVAERGLRELTHRSVDETAGVPAGTTSNHFRTRDDLLADLAAEIMRQVMAAMEDLMTGPPSPDATVESFLQQVPVVTGREGLVWCRLAVMSYSVPAVQQVVASAQRRFVGGFAEAMRAAGAPAPERHATHVAPLLVGVQMRHLCDPVPPDTVRQAITALLRGLSSAPSSAPSTDHMVAPSREWAPPADQLTRKDRVLDAAVEVLAERGTRGLTHRAVDAAGDLAEGTAKNYCRTQESLRRAALDRATTRAIIATPQRLGAPPRTESELVARLEAIYRAAVAHGDRISWQTELKAMLVLWFEAATAVEYVPLLKRGMRIWRESFASWLDALGAADAELGGEAIEAYLIGMILMTYGIPDLDLAPGDAVAALVAGLLHPPEQAHVTAEDVDESGQLVD